MSNLVRRETNTGCPQLPGTVLRINIPAGAAINVLNLFEIASPSGICFIIRLPFLSGQCGGSYGPHVDNLLHAVRQAGGTVEFVNQ